MNVLDLFGSISLDISNFKTGVENAKKAMQEIPQKASDVMKSTGENLKGIAETVANTALSAVNAASRCGIDALLDRSIHAISGGERQLAYIARALAQRSEIIVMDEPTSALDVSNQHMVLSLLKDLVNVDGKTILLSSHNPNHALYLDCNVFIMKDGSIIESGYAREMITVEKLKPIYGDDVCLSSEQEYFEISFKD